MFKGQSLGPEPQLHIILSQEMYKKTSDLFFEIFFKLSSSTQYNTSNLQQGLEQPTCLELYGLPKFQGIIVGARGGNVAQLRGTFWFCPLPCRILNGCRKVHGMWYSLTDSYSGLRVPFTTLTAWPFFLEDLDLLHANMLSSTVHCTYENGIIKILMVEMHFIWCIETQWH